MVIANNLSLPTTINGEFEAFRTGNRDVVNQNEDNDNALNNINECAKVIKPMKWLASISRYIIHNDILELSLINHDGNNNNNNNTHNHGDDKFYTNDAICEVATQILNDTGASIQ